MTHVLKFFIKQLGTYTFEVYFYISSFIRNLNYTTPCYDWKQQPFWDFDWSDSTLFTHFTFICQFSNLNLQKCQAIIEWHPFAQLRTSAWWPLDSPKLLCSLVEFMSYHLHILSECMFSVARLTLCAGETTNARFF